MNHNFVMDNAYQKAIQREEHKRELAAVYKPKKSIQNISDRITAAEKARAKAAVDIDEQIRKAEEETERIDAALGNLSVTDFEKAGALKAERAANKEKVVYLKSHRAQFLDKETMKPTDYEILLNAIIREADEAIDKSKRELLACMEEIEKIDSEYAGCIGYLEDLMARLQNMNSGTFTPTTENYKGIHRQGNRIVITDFTPVTRVLEDMKNSNTLQRMKEHYK